MEHFPLRLSNMGPLYPDFLSDKKARFWQNSSQSCACAEVICPQPHRAARIPYFIEGLSRFSPEPKSILPRNRGETGFEILGVILNKDDMELGGDTGGNEIGFFCGSPPVRTHNPVIHDAQFTKQMKSAPSPLSSPLPVPNPSEKPEGASSMCSSSTMGGSPKIRVEGFACGKSDSRCVVPALA